MSAINAAAAAKASKVFRGDDEALVDQLLAACHEHKNIASAAPLPGFGRDLLPYFAKGEDVPTPTQISPSAPKRKPHYQSPQSSNTSSRDASPKQSASPSARKAFATPSASPSMGRPSNAAASASPSSKSPAKKSARSKFPRSSSSPAPACPGMFSSPNPTDLPAPSLHLLARAGWTPSPTSQMSRIPGMSATRMLLAGAA